MSVQPTLNPYLLPIFGLDEEGFAKIIYATGAFVAGGACLAAFQGKSLEAEQDLDIWLPTPTKRRSDDSGLVDRLPVEGGCTYPFEKAAMYVIRTYLLSRGYKEQLYNPNKLIQDPPYLEDKPGDPTSFKNTIRRMYNFHHEGLKSKIQVLECFNLTHTEILERFDLDVCQFYTHVRCGEFQVRHLYGEPAMKTIREGIMAFTDDREVSERTKKRVEKYKARGFRFEEKAVPASAPVPPSPADKILTTMAEKVKAYEDFFASKDGTLVVVGTQGGGEGKSAAFMLLKKRPVVTFFGECDIPFRFESVGYTEYENELGGKVIYHLYNGDKTLIDGLREKYDARVVYFARGTESAVTA